MNTTNNPPKSESSVKGSTTISIVCVNYLLRFPMDVQLTLLSNSSYIKNNCSTVYIVIFTFSCRNIVMLLESTALSIYD